MSILQIVDLKKDYGEEPNITHALKGIQFEVDKGICLHNGSFLAWKEPLFELYFHHRHGDRWAYLFRR